MKKIFYLILLTVLLQSCNKVGFSGGLVALPILGVIAAVVSFYKWKKTGSIIPRNLFILSVLATIGALIAMWFAT